MPIAPGANPLITERAPWRSSQSCATGGQQPIGNPYGFLSFLLHTWQPLCDPNSHSWGKALSATRGLAPRGVRHAPDETRKCPRKASIQVFGVQVSRFHLTCCDPSRHLQESPGPPGPKSQKSLKKGLFGGLEKSLKKYPKKSKNTEKIPKRAKIGIFRLFRVFFETFFQTLLKTFLRFRAWRARRLL